MSLCLLPGTTEGAAGGTVTLRRVRGPARSGSGVLEGLLWSPTQHSLRHHITAPHVRPDGSTAPGDRAHLESEPLSFCSSFELRFLF